MSATEVGARQSSAEKIKRLNTVARRLCNDSVSDILSNDPRGENSAMRVCERDPQRLVN